MTPFWGVSDLAEYCNDHFKMVEDTDDSFRMWQGLVGPSYTPIMSNDGTLSWTNNGNLPNPEAVNIRGPQGAGIRIAGIVDSVESLPASAADGAIWLVGEGSPYEGYAWISSGWIDLGPLTVGPAGPPGPQGDDYELTEADKQEIAEISESILLTELDSEPLGVRYGGTGARTVEGAKQMLGIDEITDKLGTWPLGTDAQDVAGAINEMIGEIDLQVADIEQLKNNFAGEFSPTSTYTVGTYVVYDGAFWRCTTAVTTAGSWTGNSNWTQVTAGGELKTANTNISTLASDISDLNTALSGKVSKSGDTMTGNLEIANTSPGEVLKNTAMDVTDSSYTQNNSIGCRLQDKNGKNVVIITDRYFANGSTGLWMTGWKNVNGSNISNSLGLYVDKNGNRVVDVSDPAAWRSALGLGTSGALPITPAQGGTGATSLDTFFIDQQTTITTTPSSADVLMTYSSGTYRIAVSGSQTVFPGNYGILEVITAADYGMLRFTKANSTDTKLYVRTYNTVSRTWYDSDWRVIGT